jgi:hypothetical protein
MICVCTLVVVRQTLAAALRSDVDVLSSLEARMALYQAVGRLCDKVRAHLQDRGSEVHVSAVGGRPQGGSWTAPILNQLCEFGTIDCFVHGPTLSEDSENTRDGRATLRGSDSVRQASVSCWHVGSRRLPVWT